MRLMFWNLGRRDVPRHVASIAHDHDVDLVILAESRVPSAAMLTALNTGRRRTFIIPKGTSDRIQMFARFRSASVSPILDRPGVAARHVRPPLGASVLIIAVHLPSQLRQDEREQLLAAPRLRGIIEEAEAHVGHRRTVLVGDLNMNPFDGGVVGADGLHAVMSRRTAEREARVVQGESRQFFYNPMWNHFGDRGPSPPGTYFYGGSSQIVFFWHIFDQVLLRPALLPFFDDDHLQIVTHVAGQSLLRQDGRPDQGVGSDHFPVVASFSTERAVLHVEGTLGKPREARG